MTKTTDAQKLLLYDLVLTEKDADGTDGKRASFSPFVWTTKFDLGVLGLEYKQKGLTFVQIREDLAREYGNEKISVPTVVAGEEVVTDSWSIAEWLEENYAKPVGKSLFGRSDAGKTFARFIESWAMGAVLQPLVGFILPIIYTRLTPPSSTYFLVTRYSNSTEIASAAITNLSNTAELDSACSATRTNLLVLESLLAYHEISGLGGWIAGKEPGHADALVWGWYAWSRLNPGLSQVWEGPELPKVGAWVHRVLESGVINPDELF